MLSIIIPAYNSEKTIIRALDSIKSQTKPQLISEIIVVNDGSKDGTQTLVEDYAFQNPNLPIVILGKENGGVSSARNLGMSSAKGDWIALLDSDDEWLPKKLELQFSCIEAHPEIDFLGGNHTETPLMIFWKKINRLYRPTIEDLCIKVFPQTSTVIFRKKIFSQLGGFDEERSYCEDAQYFYRIALNYNYYYMPEQLSIYDGGKLGFGESGLSQNIREMNIGTKQNYKELREQKSITLLFYLFIILFNELKYYRRLWVTKRNS